MQCPHRPPCPGCPRLGDPGVPAPALDALGILAAEAGLPPPAAIEGPPTGWRHRARLAVRGRATSPKIGIFQEGSHRIADIPQCLVHHPLVNQAAATVRETVRQTGTLPYAEGPHRGLLRYVQLVVERATESVQMVLVANDVTPQALEPLADALTTALGPRLHSLWWNGNPERTNVILGPHWHRWSGPAATRETIGGASIFYPPGAFGQANLPLADRLVALVHGWIPDGLRVVELHSGVGATGLGLVARSVHVAFNETSPDALAGLALGLAALPAAARDRSTVHPGPAADHLATLDAADVVICDPPRRGLGPVLLERLVADPPRRLVLISCHLDAFLTEARALLTGGRAALSAVVPFALFPWTGHSETVALFERH